VFKDSDIAGFNSNKFDVPMLAEEFLRADVQDVDFSICKKIDVQVIYHKHEPRTLAAAYKFYCNADLENAHSALADTAATYEVLKAQLDKYDDLENSVDFLDKYSNFTKNVDLDGKIVYDENGKEMINFGKYKSRYVEELFRADPGYISWMLAGDFPLSTKQVLVRLRKKYTGK
jgi:DNA polymerase-3 subunit epsilon